MSLRRLREESKNTQLMLLSVPLATKRTGSESERLETDWLVTVPGRSCGKLADSDPWPIGASLNKTK